ncbi:MAG: U4/U6 small nuclear ribonucleoprotein prp4 [Bogoriella megaspora]|nr:MAG: U4/U6 small nuclear ribonucleoprotein prp4 [Bogoriella megaspora]
MKSSESEGEIIESEHEKATTARPYVKKNGINTTSSLSSDSDTPIRSVEGIDGDDDSSTKRNLISYNPYANGLARGRGPEASRSPSPFYHSKLNNHGRSLSPYRDPSHRGKKRRHEDTNDGNKQRATRPRHNGARYENLSSNGNRHQGERQYQDYDNPRDSRPGLDYGNYYSGPLISNSRHGESIGERSLAEKRSSEFYAHNSLSSSDHSDKRVRDERSSHGLSRKTQGSVSGRGYRSMIEKTHSSKADHSNASTGRAASTNSLLDAELSNRSKPSNGKTVEFLTTENAQAASAGTEDAQEPAAPKSEAEMIEERRKKRQALKDKHTKEKKLRLEESQSQNNVKDIAAPRNDEAIFGMHGDAFAANINDMSHKPKLILPQKETTMSTTDSPSQSNDINHQSIILDTMSPRTPEDLAESPKNFTLERSLNTNGEEASTATAAADGLDDDDVETSAAKYDPKHDMEEDQLRNEKRMHQNREVPAADYNDQHIDREIPDSQPTVTVNNAETQDQDYDMFSDEADEVLARQTGKSGSKVLNQTSLGNGDDVDGFYKVAIGEIYDGRYRVTEKIGQGVFARVVRAVDTKTNKTVAVKMLRNNHEMRRTGLKELNFLRRLRDSDPSGQKPIVQFEGNFNFNSHLCIVFEDLNINLRTLLGTFNKGVSLQAVRAFAKALFHGLDHLAKHKIVHGDIKPDNILTVDKEHKQVKICDFGSAKLIDDILSTQWEPYLVSRYYRAPEIMLGIPPGHLVDIWSVGCTLFEMYTGNILFTGDTNLDMLLSFMECRGRFTKSVLNRAIREIPRNGNDRFPFARPHLDYFFGRKKDRLTKRMIPHEYHLNEFPVQGRDLRTRVLRVEDIKREDTEALKLRDNFINLLDGCLQLDTDKRIQPRNALTAEFFATKLESNKTAIGISKAPSAPFRIRKR